MKKLAIAAVTGSALLTGIVTASAADMAVKAAPIPMAPVAFSWTGFYVGAPIFAVPVTQTVTVDFGKIEWMASFRGRAGFAVDRALFYVTGGAAVAEFGGSTTTLVNGPGIGLPPAGTYVATNGGTSTRWGWTVGGGIEWAFSQN